MKMLRRLCLTTPTMAAVLMTVAVSAEPAAGLSVEVGPGDQSSLEATGDATLITQDPLGLIQDGEWERLHALGEDLIEVWVCDSEAWSGPAQTPATYTSMLNDEIAPYFEHHSRARYTQRFVAGGMTECGDGYTPPIVEPTNPSTNLIFAVYPQGTCCVGGGAGNRGSMAEFAKDSGRAAIAGTDGTAVQGVDGPTAVHEIGHTLWWDHSHVVDYGAYDVVHDVMSGNTGSLEPYGTAVINYYASGWIDWNEVVVVPASGTSVTLLPTGSTRPGHRMAAIPDGTGRAWVFGTRISHSHDPISEAWEGVEIYHVSSIGDHGGPEGRTVVPFGDLPAISGNLLDAPIPHVVPAGETVTVSGVRVSVSEAQGGYRVSFGPGSPPLSPPPCGGFLQPDCGGGRFEDVSSGHTFFEDIERLADRGVTRGCNPPDNTRFCPDDRVTRGQMAAFLNRALELESGSGSFTDTPGHHFEADITALAARGITRGCNPPANTRFCPDDHVTRGQMAAFLTRALGLDPSNRSFTDTEGHVFQEDVAALAEAGITRGCNPPANTRFCPDDHVTRAQMAAFLTRATLP